MKNKQATHAGFEPAISAVTRQRPLHAGPMGQNILKAGCESRTRLSILEESHTADMSILQYTNYPARTRTWTATVKVLYATNYVTGHYIALRGGNDPPTVRLTPITTPRGGFEPPYPIKEVHEINSFAACQLAYLGMNLILQ